MFPFTVTVAVWLVIGFEQLPIATPVRAYIKVPVMAAGAGKFTVELVVVVVIV